MKLVVAEPETAALRSWLADWQDHTSSVLAQVEVPRAARRAVASRATSARSRERNQDAVLRQAAEVLSRIGLVRIDENILDRASRLEPEALRSLDAIHLATALSLEGLAGFVTYDDDLVTAARDARLAVFSPGH